MFEDSNFDDGKKKGRTLRVSLVVSVGLFAVLILIPVIYTEALSAERLRAILVPPPSPQVEVAPQPEIAVREIIELDRTGMIAPPQIPDEGAQVVNESPRQQVRQIVGQTSSRPRGVVPELPGQYPLPGFPPPPPRPPTATAPPPPPPCLRPQGPPPPAERIRVSSGVTAANLITRVEVPYPALARTARISGIVLLEAIIGPDGTIQHLCVIVGHPLLAPAALEAVGQWKYRPTMINGEPVEVITTISVPFSLD